MSTTSSGILQTISGEIQRLAESSGRSVLGVSSFHGNGSGFAWDEHTMVTAYHVIRGAEEVTVRTSDGRKLSARVAGRFRRADVAVLTVEAVLTPSEKGDSQSLKSGQFVLALANSIEARPSVTSGIVTGAGRTVGGWRGVTIEDAIVTDARVNPGYSGGPLVDASGRVIGMNVAYFSKRGIAVPVATISKVVDRVENGQPFKKAYLGILSHPVSLPADVASSDGVGQDSGVMVCSVQDGTPAKLSGLSFGDIILRFDGKAVSDSEDLSGLLGEEAIGKRTEVSVLRGGAVVDLEVTPATGRED